MKVALITFHSFSQPGGIKGHVLGLHKEFKKRGIKSKIIVPRRDWSENYGKDVMLLGSSFPLKFSGSQSDFCVNFNPLAIEKVLRKEKFDILHFHNFGFPSIVQILERSKTLNVLTLHADVKGSKFLKNFPILVSFVKKTVQWRVDGVIGVNPLNLSIFNKYKGPKVVIPNGVDLKRFNPTVLKIKKYQDGKISLLFVGRIEKRKGLIYLLKAFKILNKKFSNLRLIIVGEGPLKEECRNWAKKNKLSGVFFEGKKTDRELASYYSSSHIFVSPAVFGESFGIVLLEAMASGLAVVGFANRGYKEFLRNKKGEKFLVKPKDYMALAKKIETLIRDEKLRKRMGDWGAKEAQKYSWEKVANQVLIFYKLCKKNQKRRNGNSFDKLFKKLYSKNILDWLIS